MILGSTCLGSAVSEPAPYVVDAGGEAGSAHQAAAELLRQLRRHPHCCAVRFICVIRKCRLTPTCDRACRIHAVCHTLMFSNSGKNTSARTVRAAAGLASLLPAIPTPERAGQPRKQIYDSNEPTCLVCQCPTWPLAMGASRSSCDTLKAEKSVCAGRPDIASQQPCAHARSAQLSRAIRPEMSAFTTFHLSYHSCLQSLGINCWIIVNASGVRPQQLVASAYPQKIRLHYRWQCPASSCSRGGGPAGSSPGADLTASRLRRCRHNHAGGCHSHRRPGAGPRSTVACTCSS